MQSDLAKLKSAVATSMASLNRTEQQLANAKSEALKWEGRAKLALQKGEESLAKDALVRKKTFTDTVNVLTPQMTAQTAQVDTLKAQLRAMESKIAEAKIRKDMLKIRAQSAKATEQMQKALSDVDPSSALSAFERMEEKVLTAEAKAQAAGELGGMSNAEQQFAQLEGSDVDDELLALKAQMSGGALPPASSTTPASLPAAKEDPTDDDWQKLLENNR
jgi:phage shock protein A